MPDTSVHAVQQEPELGLVGKHYTLPLPSGYTPYIVGEPGFAHTLVLQSPYAQIALSIYSAQTDDSAEKSIEQHRAQLSKDFTALGDDTYQSSETTESTHRYTHANGTLARLSAHYNTAQRDQVAQDLDGLINTLQLHRDHSVTALDGEALEITPLPRTAQ